MAKKQMDWVEGKEIVLSDKKGKAMLKKRPDERQLSFRATDELVEIAHKLCEIEDIKLTQLLRRLIKKEAREKGLLNA